MGSWKRMLACGKVRLASKTAEKIFMRKTGIEVESKTYNKIGNDLGSRM